MEPVSLRPYQQIAIHDVRRCFGDGLKRVMVYSPTGSGKGEIAVALAQFAQNRNKRCLFLVHRKDLVKQQWQRFNKYGMTPGILQGTNTWKPHSEITVGSIQTFASRKKFGWNFNFDLIITLSPEAHHKAIDLTRTVAAEVQYWPTPDPTDTEGSREQRLNAYREVRDQLLALITAKFAATPPEAA